MNDAPFSNTQMKIEQTLDNLLKKIQSMPRKPDSEYDQQRYREVMEYAGCPFRHRQTKTDHDEAWGDCLGALQKKLTTGYTVILCGARGTGKTQVSVEAIKDAARRGFSARYDTFYRFCQRLKETFDSRHLQEADVMLDYIRPRLLVLDEVGKVSATEWSQSALFHLIDRRYNAMKDTILITNHNASEVAKELGASIVRRADETGGTIDTSTWKKRHLA